MNIKILDCTVRDGGHLNKWKFSSLCVKASYYAALKAGIDYFEFGYRNSDSVKDLGDFGYCRDKFLLELINPSARCKPAVMADAGKTESTLFCECKPGITPIRAVRIAAYPYELEKGINLVEDIHAKGYDVFLNLMAASEINKSQLEILRKWKNKDILEAVYFADSFGSFLPTDIPVYIKQLKSLGFKRIGFHPHNNLQLAFANTLKAIEEGATYVDASVYGMGRGSGNLPIEVLVGYLEKKAFSQYNPVPYIDVIERFYQHLFKQFDWGYKIKSLLGGLKNIHPYYVDDLFRRRNFTVDEIWNALDAIKEKCPISYSPAKLNETLEARFYNPLKEETASVICEEIQEQLKIIPAADAFRAGDFPLRNKHSGKKFMIIANGPSLVKYKNEIARLITNEGLITIGVNFLQNTFVPAYHVFVNRKRFLKYAHSIDRNSTLLVPSFFGKSLINENCASTCFYFDIETIDDPQVEPIKESTQRCVNLNVAVSAILIAFDMGASEILAVGMDGYVDEMSKQLVYFYNENDVPDDRKIASYRYEKLSEELERINRFLQEKGVLFSIITPTSHKKYYRNILHIED